MKRAKNAHKAESIFVDEHVRFRSRAKGAAWHNTGFERYLAEVNEWAERTLTRAKLWPVKEPMSRLVDAVNLAKRLERTRNNTPPYFAARVIRFSCDLERALRACDARLAADAGIRIAENRTLATVAEMERAYMAGSRQHKPGQAANTRRAQAAAERHGEWQAEARRVWRRNPRLTASAVARLIAPTQWKTVRRHISKPRSRAVRKA